MTASHTLHVGRPAGRGTAPAPRSSPETATAPDGRPGPALDRPRGRGTAHRLAALLAGFWACTAPPPAAGAVLRLSLESAAAATRAGAEIFGRVRFVPAADGTFAEFAAGGLIRLPLGPWFNPRNGSVRLEVRPGWAGTDAKRHAFLHLQAAPLVHFTIFKDEGGALRFVYRGRAESWFGVSIPVRDWRPGQWHTIAVGWRELSPGRLLLALEVDGRKRYGIGAAPFPARPDVLVLGGRGSSGVEPAAAGIRTLRIEDRWTLDLPVAVGPKPPVVASIDVAASVGPFRRVHDFVTIWNSRSNPLPFRRGDATWRRFREAQFSLVRLVAFSESWLWGIALSRNAAGRIEADYTDFDRLVEAVRSAGAQPYVRLAYHTPGILSSANGDAARDPWRVRYAPPRDPAEWAELMRDIVRHCRARRFGVRYYVTSLNEADLAVRRGAAEWADVCRLYAETTRAVKQVDPEARCGGPALALDVREDGGPLLREFVRSCRRGKVPLDFVAFHAYRKAFPAEYGAIVRRVRRIVREESPEGAVEPEYFVDEFNLWAQDRTQDDQYAAAYITAAEHFMRRAGATKVSLVSFNHFLPLFIPRREIVNHRGPFSKTSGQAARFLPGRFSAGGVEKTGILAHPPNAVRAPGAYTFGRWRIELPDTPGLRLTFSTGIAIRRFAKMDGVSFQVLIADSGAPVPVFAEHQRARTWRSHTVDLAKFAGRAVRIEFRTTAGPPGSNTMADWGVWGEPRLAAGPGPAPSWKFDFVEHVDAAETGAVEPEYRFRYGEDAIRRYIGLPLIKGTVVTAPFFALLLQSRLKARELKLDVSGAGGILPDNAAGIQATGDERGAAVLVWTFDPAWNGKRRFDITLRGFRPGRELRVARYLIDSTHSNPYYDYVVAGKPDNHGRYNLESGAPDRVGQATVRADARGVCRVSFALEPMAVCLVTCEGPVSSPPHP